MKTSFHILSTYVESILFQYRSTMSSIMPKHDASLSIPKSSLCCKYRSTMNPMRHDWKKTDWMRVLRIAPQTTFASNPAFRLNAKFDHNSKDCDFCSASICLAWRRSFAIFIFFCLLDIACFRHEVKVDKTFLSTIDLRKRRPRPRICPDRSAT